MSGLTTHILDTSLGTPVPGVSVQLFAVQGHKSALISTHITNADGRCDTPMLSGEAFTTGVYELVYEMGDYLRQHHADLPDPLFLDRIVIRFGISNTQDHYHVPLLVSPFGYSTYRGS